MKKILFRSTVKYNFVVVNKFGGIMKSYVRRLGIKCHKIFRSIIVLDLVKMMNRFPWKKESFKFFLDNKSVLKNIPFCVSIRMMRRVNPDISEIVPNNSFKICGDMIFFKFRPRRKTFSFNKFNQISNVLLASRAFFVNLAKLCPMFFRPFFSFIPGANTKLFLAHFFSGVKAGLVMRMKTLHRAVFVFSFIKNGFTPNAYFFHAAILSFVLCFPSIILAQVPSKNNIFVLDSFDGGLDTKTSAFALPNNKADIVENVRFDTELKTLTKRDKVTTAYTNSDNEASTGLFRLYLNNGTKVTINTHGDAIDSCSDSTGTCTKILSLSVGDHKWDWLAWHNMAIGTDGYNQPVKYDGTSASATYLGAPLAIDAGSGAGPNGVYTYKVACYTTSYNVSLNVPSNTITVSDNDINLSMIPVCPDTFLGEDIIGRKIYRTEAGGSTYKLLSNGTIADNSTLTLVDSDADGALGATYPTTYIRQVPLGKRILVHKNRLWLGNNPTYPSRLYFSDDGGQDYFGYMADTQGAYGGYFDIRPDDGDEITFTKNLLGKLTVSKNNTIQKMDTDGDIPSEDWAISDPFSFIGCQAPYSAVNTPLGVIYLGNNGLYTFNGQYSLLISEDVTPEIKDIAPSNYPNVWGVFSKNTFYMAYTSLKSGMSVNNRVMVFDVLSKAFSIDTLSLNVFTVFNSGSDVEALYSASSLNGKIYAHTNTLKEVIHKTHSDFAGTWDDARYVPTTAGGNANSPVLEIAWTDSMDNVVGTIDSVTGVIDRPDTDGTYISQYLTVNANTFDKLYWNESIPSTGGDVTVALRSGATTSDCATAAWSSEYTSPVGADISAATADTVLQYRISMTANDITASPNLVLRDNYVLRLTYDIAGVSDETTIPIEWRSGWLDFMPGYKKTLTKIYAYYEVPEGATGTLDINIKNFEGDADNFEINYATNPNYYAEYFTGGALTGEQFRIDITENSLNSVKIKKIILLYSLEPLI